MTGDLRIITNSKLRKLMVKGPKYREPVSICFSSARDEIQSALDILIDKWGNESGQDARCFDDWKHTAMSLVDERISNLTSKVKLREVCSVLNQPMVKSYLKKLHRDFIITPIEKATGKVALICKRFYAHVLAHELGVKGTLKEDSTYCECADTDSDSIVNKNKDDLQKRFKLKVDTDMKCLPQMYWLPKMHKNPTKFRFIVAADRCSAQPLAKTLTSVFKPFYHKI